MGGSATSTKSIGKLAYILAFLASLSLIFLGTFAGDATSYTIGSYSLIAITVYSFLRKSHRNLILLAITVFLVLRYIPIMKFNQPLYMDPVYEMATAEEFQKNGNFSILAIRSPKQATSLQYQSGWPLVHALGITISDVTGLSLFTVFTYFAPLIDLSSLLLVSLFASYIFKSREVGALSGLMYATFFANIFWTGTQLIRQNIAFSLALLGLYCYVRGRMGKKRKFVALGLLFFSLLPVAHHLTPMVMFYVFLSLFLFEVLINYGGRLRALIFSKSTYRQPEPHTITLLFCFLVGIAMFFWWTTYAGKIIFPLFARTTYDTILSVMNLESGGEFQEATVKSGGLLNFSNATPYDLLSYAKLLFIAAVTLYGLYILVKKKDKARNLLLVLVFAPLIVAGVAYFAVRDLEAIRYIIFLSIPAFAVTAGVLHKLDRRILVLCLLIIMLPAPFELFDLPGDPTPTFIYDRHSTGNIVLTRDVTYRDGVVLAAASFFSSHAKGNLTADGYTASALVFYYDPYMVWPQEYVIRVFVSPKPIYGNLSTVLIDRQYFDNKFLIGMSRGLYEKYVSGVEERFNVTVSLKDLENYDANLNSVANRVYDDGSVAGWEIIRIHG